MDVQASFYTSFFLQCSKVLRTKKLNVYCLGSPSMGNCEGSQHRTAVRRRKVFFSGRGEKEEGGGALSAVGGKRGRRHFTLVPGPGCTDFERGGRRTFFLIDWEASGRARGRVRGPSFCGGGEGECGIRRHKSFLIFQLFKLA